MNNDPSTDQSEPIATESPEQQPGLPSDDAQIDAPIEFSWQASEYVQHHKSPLWYAGVVGAVVVLSVGAAWLPGLIMGGSAGGLNLEFWLSTALFVVMGAAVIIYAQRPPRMMQYDLSADGMAVNGRLYSYHQFRSFSVVRDIAWHAIELEPTQRFMPRMSVLFNDDDFEAIVGHLVGHLPRVDRNPDMIERVTRYLRF